MKIYGSRGFDPLKLYSQTAKKPSGAGATGDSTPDEVSISEQGKTIHRAMAALASVPDVRDDKVQAIRARIEAGTYEVSGEQVAKAILSRAIRRGDLSELRRKPDRNS